MKKYSGKLNRDGAKMFLSDFYKFYACAKTKVTVIPDETHENFDIVLEPEETFSGILEAFFTDYSPIRRGKLPKFQELAT